VLGPPDGRYVLRPAAEADVEHVLVLRTLGARERRLLGRRSRPAEGEPAAAPVPTSRATVILAAQALEDEAAAKAWARRAGEDEVAEAVKALNAAIRAHRLAATDPTVREVSSRQALMVRVGYGTGDEVAEGRWTDARELYAEHRQSRRRASTLRPAERLAGILGGRDEALACEDLALRARLDLDHGRMREAALQLDAALGAAVVELEGDDRRDLGERRAELVRLRDDVAAAAEAARRGELHAEQRETVTTALARLEAALRARAVAGTGG
jgi:hypothetical protein